MARGGGFKTLGRAAGPARSRLSAGAAVEAAIRSRFHLPSGSFSVRIKGDVLFLSSQDKTAQYTLAGMEAPLLKHLRETGLPDLRIILWDKI